MGRTVARESPDAGPSVEWWHVEGAGPADPLAALGIEAGRSVAVAGAADRHVALAVAAAVAPAPTYVVDRDGTVLDEVEAWAIERGIEGVETTSGDPRELSSLLPGRVDRVLVAGWFGAVEAPTAFADQVVRSLRPGGRLVVVAEGTVPAGTRAAVRPAGLVVDREVDLPAEHVGVVLRRPHDR